MTAKLTIEIQAPLTDDDLYILNGAAMTIMALIGSMEGQPEEEGKEPTPDPLQEVIDAVAAAQPHTPDVPAPCGKAGEEGKVCISAVGHVGRHLYRRPVAMAN